MKAHYQNDNGDLRIIRPLAYVRERYLREYATLARLPVIDENCPACFEAPKERARVKLMLASQEHVHANVFSCLLRTMKPLMRGELEKKRGVHAQQANTKTASSIPVSMSVETTHVPYHPNSRDDIWGCGSEWEMVEKDKKGDFWEFLNCAERLSKL
eukprot:CAMPEP_0197520860 /NCGR_PEP_ID=MMETSP1318-20131121/6192_1 /TAXON_ID=552666 /ORGANISM="Partenskyella glossopodia, Strain RCC365" /LENGTH=156 /DNA_ID=CAMNT_0043072617 /DNA_START=368 /DNA_END=838 /DNA_ORIENTATION=+